MFPKWQITIGTAEKSSVIEQTKTPPALEHREREGKTMDEVSELIIEKMKQPIYAVQVPNRCAFWMIRTKSGAYYNEYIEQNYIAIGWNAIRQHDISQCSDEKMRQMIEASYEDKRPGAAISKCRSFVETMQIGDLVMILGEKRVTFAIIGEYFEKHIQECITKELEADVQIAAGFHKQNRIACPYVKRRKIQIIKELEESRLTPMLARAMLNHHSLSEINDYAIPVLNTCFDLYVYDGETHVVFRVNTKSKIKGRDFATFCYYITEIFSTLNGDEDVSITTNLNSPGDYVVAFSQGMDFIQGHWFAFLFVFAVLFGGSYEKDGMKVEIPSIRGVIKWLCNRKHDAEIKGLETEKMKKEIDGIDLDNELKRIQIARERENSDLQKMPTDSELKKLQKASRALELQEPDPKVIIFPLSSQEDHKDGSF